MKKKMLFVFNPKAGKGKIKNHLIKMMQILTAGGYDVTIYPTKCRFDAFEYVRRVESNFDVIGCCGGDGTLNEVVGALLKNKSKVPIAYIPGGTMNDWGTNLGMSSNMETSAKMIVDGSPMLFDIGKFNGKNFNYVAAFGAFTEIAYDTSQKLKKVIGQTAYGVTALRALMRLRPFNLRVECEERTLEGKYLYGMANNSNVIGGFRLDGMHTDLHDGKFELLLIKKFKNPLDFSKLLNAAIIQDYINTDTVDVIETSKAKIIFDEPVKWTLDGEYGGKHKEIDIELVPDAINFIVPPKDHKQIRLEEKKKVHLQKLIEKKKKVF